ncbi:hypothetical protein LI328DRAFT_162359 [Trichoderma asperelloides]|nr:hypothetical protein LI328DRAFT_162359 [Trichoderma asperelloides]
MVGAAQYQDKEIDWVLSAVVSKKKQSYIQTHFKEKFGRALNHNQIRYIKNKYGKDPRFNSPLVNIRAPVRATTPEPDGSSDHEDGETQGNTVVFENQKEVGPSIATEEEQNGPEDDGTTATHPKRKRGSHEQGDALERLIKQTTKSQRLNFSPQPATTQERILRSHLGETFLQQQNISDIHLPVSHTHAHPPPMTLASPEDNCNDPLYAGIFHGIQHPQILPLHSTSTGIGWMPSMSMSDHSWDAARNTPVFTSFSGSVHPSTMIQASPSPMIDQHQKMEHMMFHSPAIAHYSLRLPSSQLVSQQVSQISPATPSLSLAPYTEHQEQQHHQLLQQEQQLHSHIDTGITSTFPSSSISNLESQTIAENLSGVAPQLIPSFHEVPIESTCPQHGTKHLNLAEMGSCINWAHTSSSHNSSPQDLSLFNFTSSPMSFPIENVRHEGLTVASSQAMHQSVLKNPNIYSSNFPTQGHGQQHVNLDASAFELLSMAQTPILNTTTAMPYTQLSYPVSNSTMAFSPLMVQAGYRPHLFHGRSTPGTCVHDINGAANDVSSTIDPRLLATNSASPHPCTSMSPLDEAKYEKEPPTTTSSP